MNLVKLGKKGQVSIPQAVLRQIGIPPEAPLQVEATADGAIVLRQVSVHPIEIYSDERIAEFERGNALTPAEMKRAKPLLDAFQVRMKRRMKAAAAQPAAPRAAEPAGAYRVEPQAPARKRPRTPAGKSGA